MEKVSSKSLISTIFTMMINPKKGVKELVGETKWYLALLVSGVAFGLFFFQSAMDLFKTGQRGFFFVVTSLIGGMVYGLVIIPAIGFIAYVIMKAFKYQGKLRETLISFCLSYSGTLVYGVIGIIFSLFLGWKTAIAFGVGGVLWAVGPIILTCREMYGGKIGLGVFIATIYSGLVLMSWSLWGSM